MLITLKTQKMKTRKKSIVDFKKKFKEQVNKNLLNSEYKTEDAIILALYFMKGYFEKDNTLISKVLNEIIMTDNKIKFFTTQKTQWNKKTPTHPTQTKPHLNY